MSKFAAIGLVFLCSVLIAVIPNGAAQESGGTSESVESLDVVVAEAGTGTEVEEPVSLTQEVVDLSDALIGVAVMNEQIEILCRLQYGDDVCRAEGLLQ